ncbi:polysaccharide deacetylase [Clostridium fermenticellae]|uniref:Polysaccharide deacetylase n=1 Tax=Clostridium fermenticellae TaxID=2068654 RepID=A0A386H2E1_9CLOT|nr:polysaccharide deacetylase family protein [Clostridium fermenticellae]AYD39738.1 polysaccharide deacetylase [Clostridium fermenticellae]
MDKYGEGGHGKRNNARRNREIKRIIIMIISLVALFSIGLFIGGKISGKKTAMASVAKEKNQKQLEQKKMNERESKINPINTKDSSGFNPYKSDGKKVVYLTFDDGPSRNNTPKILKILKQYNVKATFFLIGKNAEQNKDLVKEEINDGHVVGNHSYTHEMHYLYSNPEIFLNDLNKCDKTLKSIIGPNYKLKIMRFPGGSFGRRLAPFRDAAKKAGYHYVDWNDLTGDAEHNNVPVANLINNVKKYDNHDHLVVLMHDAPAKVTTVEALPGVIQYFKSKGYIFETLK